jgi:hypothetical protein
MALITLYVPSDEHDDHPEQFVQAGQLEVPHLRYGNHNGQFGADAAQTVSSLVKGGGGRFQLVVGSVWLTGCTGVELPDGSFNYLEERHVHELPGVF